MELYAVKSWYDRRMGVVTLEDDVLGVVRDVKAVDDRLTVYYNQQSDEYDIVECCLDGTERLVFSVRELDQRVVNRLREADHWHGNEVPTHIKADDEDFATLMEQDNEQLQREKDKEGLEKIADAGERVAWALDLPLKGNVGMKESIFIKRSPFGENGSVRDPQ